MYMYYTYIHLYVYLPVCIYITCLSDLAKHPSEAVCKHPKHAPGPARLTTGPKKRKKLDASCETVQRESTVEGRRENCAAKHVSAKVGMPVCSVTWISCDG